VPALARIDVADLAPVDDLVRQDIDLGQAGNGELQPLVGLGNPEGVCEVEQLLRGQRLVADNQHAVALEQRRDLVVQ
jgi:hypothetical protein